MLTIEIERIVVPLKVERIEDFIPPEIEHILKFYHEFLEKGGTLKIKPYLIEASKIIFEMYKETLVLGSEDTMSSLELMVNAFISHVGFDALNTWINEAENFYAKKVGEHDG